MSLPNPPGKQEVLRAGIVDVGPEGEISTRKRGQGSHCETFAREMTLSRTSMPR